MGPRGYAWAELRPAGPPAALEAETNWLPSPGSWASAVGFEVAPESHVWAELRPADRPATPEAEAGWPPCSWSSAAGLEDRTQGRTEATEPGEAPSPEEADDRASGGAEEQAGGNSGQTGRQWREERPAWLWRATDQSTASESSPDGPAASRVATTSNHWAAGAWKSRWQAWAEAPGGLGDPTGLAQGTQPPPSLATGGLGAGCIPSGEA